LSIVSADNERVIRLSKKMGFISLGELPRHAPDNQLGRTLIMMYEA